MERWIRHIDAALFAVAMVALVLGAAGGAWGTASDHAVVAVQLDRSGASPLYHVIAGVAAWLPVGEPWFRLAIANALIGAVLLVGIARAARALLPKDPIAGAIAAIVVAVTPPFREATAFAGPSVLAACGTVWALVFALEHARARAGTSGPADASRESESRAESTNETPDGNRKSVTADASRRHLLAMLGCALVVIGSAPWLGFALAIYLVAWQWKSAERDALVIGAAGIGASIVLLWFGAKGSLPDFAPDAAALIGNAGKGAGAVVLGAGLLGIAFAAVTGLPRAPWLVGAVAIAAAHGALVDHDCLPLLALLAIGIAVIPSGIVRAVPSAPERRHLVAAIAGVPLVGAAFVAGPTLVVEDPGSSPARVANDLLTPIPGGPGIVIATRTPTFSAVVYAQGVAEVRPDLKIVPNRDVAEAAVVESLRVGKMVASDVPRFGRFELLNAYPRGRSWQLLPSPPPDEARSIPPRADHASPIGQQLAALLAIDRALYEAAHGRLAAAAAPRG